MIPSIKATLCLTQDCTLRCRYCYAGEKKRCSMGRETAFRGLDLVMDEARRQGAALDVGFFGGEPLLEWELLQACDAYVRERAADMVAAPRFSVTTNGTLLTAERAAWLAAHRYWLFLSLDGSPRMHNLNRTYPDGRGSHAAVARALDVVNATPGMNAQLACVVSPNNHRHVTEGVEWMAAHFRGNIILNFDSWSAWSAAELDGVEAQYARCWDMVLESFRAGSPLMLEPFVGRLAAVVRNGFHACDHCRMGEREICVSVHGNLFPCSRLVGEGDSPELNLGSVETGIDRAKQAWLAAQRERIDPRCLACAARPFCTYWCGCTNYASTHDVARVSGTTCRMERHLVAHAQRVAAILRKEGNAPFMRLFGHLAPPAREGEGS